MAKARGFILQASYRVVTGPRGRRMPVVHLYGQLEGGGTFLVRDDRQRPHFYIRASDAERTAALGASTPQPATQRTFDGASVCKIEVETPPDVPPLRDRLQASGITTYEADVRFATRYLIERGIKGGCEIEGEAVAGPRPAAGSGNANDVQLTLIFNNPTLTPATVEVEPKILSFDIETDARSERLLAISLYSPAIDEVLIVDGSDRPMPANATRCKDEYAALETFRERLRALDPDVLTGWNIIDFDLTVLQKIATRVRHPFQLGRDTGAVRVRKAEGYFGSGQANIPGRLVLDGIDLLRGAFVRMEDYSLDAVAREVLGEGKVVKGDVHDRIGEIIHNYKHDLPAFALYARTDARLAYQISEKLKLIQLSFARSQLTGMTPDRVAASIASFDFLYLSELERVGVVAPTVGAGQHDGQMAQHGGHVLEPAAGLHQNVWVFDFRSLYPSIIRTFNIDPLSYVAAPVPGQDLIRTPGGAFERAPAILPRMLDELFPRRELARKNGDNVASHAIKILMNSFYGVLGTPACRFYNPALANSITGSGRELLLWARQWFENSSYRVLYGDTDSLFVLSDLPDAHLARTRGQELQVALNENLAAYIEERWQTQSKLHLQFQKLYLKLFLPRARHSTKGASKRYAGQLADKETDNIEFVGMEAVRSDWTALAKRVQRELYQRLFTDQPVDTWLSDIVRQVRSGSLDDQLVYRKGLRKSTREYVASTPPHVAAARKSTQPAGKSIGYVITTAGPEPLDNRQHPIDREHYVAKQIKPVAEPVLATLGLDFEQVIGDNRQYSLLGDL